MSKNSDVTALEICHQRTCYEVFCSLSVDALETLILSVINQRIPAVSIKLINDEVFILTKAMIDLGAVIKILAR